MKEIEQDIFKKSNIVVTTNGVVKNDGSLVMGKGIALEFKAKFDNIEYRLGKLVSMSGNHCYVTHYQNYNVISFPTKEHWREKSDINLIIQSAHEIVNIANVYNFHEVYMSRPGCSNGLLDWNTEVKPAIEFILDDRFYVCTKP